MNDPTNDWDVRFGHLLRVIALVTSITLAVLSCGGLVLLLVHTGFSFWQDIFKEHFLGTIGLIGITIASFGTVTFLRQSEGPIEFEALGFKFKGASGQVVLWGVCIIILSLCAKLLW
jgi:hypothetical protein